MRLRWMSVKTKFWGGKFPLVLEFSKPNGVIVKERVDFTQDMDRKQVRLILQALVNILEKGE